MNDTINCHYIAQTLTKPWEATGRQLHFFNFVTGEFDHKSSKNLFARKRLFDSATETRLNRLVETPFALARKGILAGRTQARNWSEYRAMVLMLALQGVRSSAALTCRADAVPLSMLLGMTDAQVNTLVREWMRGHQLLAYGLARGERLFFSSAGVFPVAVFDDATAGDIVFASAIPIHPRAFVACIPDGSDFDTFHRATINGFYYPALSLGLTADLVVIPPDLIGRDGAAEVITEWRATAREHHRLWTTARDESVLMHARGVRANLRERFMIKAGLV
jgi:hypothetical protein